MFQSSSSSSVVVVVKLQWHSQRLIDLCIDDEDDEREGWDTYYLVCSSCCELFTLESRGTPDKSR